MKLGLLPGSIVSEKTPSQTATLTDNDSGKFECRWIELKKNRTSCCKLISQVDEIIDLPIAHGEGKFVTIEEEFLNILEYNGQIVFQYSKQGEITDEYPYNPNNSSMSIAGVVNPQGNILGMMPHPERFLFKYHHPQYNNSLDIKTEYGQGYYFFKSIVDYVKANI